jgi:hypothetical protein
VPRKRQYRRPLPEGWTVTTETSVHGRHLVPGTEVSVFGRRGRARFRRRVDTPTSMWLELWSASQGMFWFVTPEQIKRVHVRRKMRAH